MNKERARYRHRQSMCLRIPDALFDVLEQVRLDRGQGRTAFICEAIEAYITGTGPHVEG